MNNLSPTGQPWPAKLTLGQCATLACVFLVAAGFRIASSTDEYFISDTADYMLAAHVGVKSLLTEDHSVTVVQLLQSWKDPAFRQHPFDALDRMGDNLGFRHLHGPGSICLLAAAYDLDLSERQQRMCWGILGAITCTLLATILYLLGAGTMIATGAGLLAAVDYRNIWTDAGPSPPHTLYLMLTMLLFTLGVVYWRSHRPWVLYAGAIVLAFATMTFELVPALVLSMGAGIAWEAWSKKALRAVAGPALRVVAVYLVTLIVLWPGGFLRGTVLVCIFGNFGVLLKWKHSTAPSSLPTLATLFGPYGVSLLLFGLFATALVTILRRLSAKNLQLNAPFVTFGCYAVFALLFGLSAHLQYIQYCPEVFFPVLLFMLLAIHVAFAGRVGWLPGAAAAILLAGACGSLYQTLTTPHELDPTRQIVRDMRTMLPPGDAAVVTNDQNIFNTLRLYLPGYHFERTVSPASIELKRPEEEPRVKLGLVNTGTLDGPTQERAKLLYPPRFIYRANNAYLWLGERQIPAR